MLFLVFLTHPPSFFAIIPLFWLWTLTFRYQLWLFGAPCFTDLLDFFPCLIAFLTFHFPTKLLLVFLVFLKQFSLRCHLNRRNEDHQNSAFLVILFSWLDFTLDPDQLNHQFPLMKIPIVHNFRTNQLTFWNDKLINHS